MDIFKTKAGKCCVLEMNARFGGGFPFSYLAGVDMPKAIIMWLKGEEWIENFNTEHRCFRSKRY